MKHQGPLTGVKVVEFVGLGPAPFAAMLLADMGADVVRVDRPGAQGGGGADVLGRGRRSIALNLKTKEGVDAALQLAGKADILLEGYRPGVMERLGVGPDACFIRNPALVYGRMTGWGQHGPLAHAAGHDINYIALTGALHAIGPREEPLPPLNLVGDFGGGSLYLAMGVLAALVHARATGEGQVVDAAIVDGAASLLSAQHQLMALGIWKDERSANWLDGAAPFYRTYECADGKFISLGPLEPEFFALLLEKLGLAGDPDFADILDTASWERLNARFEAIFRARPRDHWDRLFEGTDVCYAPVLSLTEAAEHPHMKARGVFQEIDGVMQAAPAPRFSATPGATAGPAPKPGQDTRAALLDWGFTPEDVSRLAGAGAIANDA